MLQLAQRTDGAEIDQRLDQDGGLNGHVQRAGDAHAGQRLVLGVLAADRHQAGHFVLGDGDFLAAPFGQREVGDFEFGGGLVDRCSAHLLYFSDSLVSINLDTLILALFPLWRQS